MTSGSPDPMREKRALAKSAARAGGAISVWIILRILLGFASIPLVQHLTDNGASAATLQMVSLAVSAVGLYVIATPIALWILGVFKQGRFGSLFAKSALSAGETAAVIPIMYLVTILINLAATVIRLLGGNSAEQLAADNPLLNLPSSTLGVVLNYVWMVVLAPVFEELLFRGALLGSLKEHGSWFAVIVSGLLFGLAHINISMMLYATALGMLLGMLYLRAGSVIPCIIAHVCINFLGITISTFYGTGNTVVLGIMGLVVIAALIAGLVLLIVTLAARRDRLRLPKVQTALTGRQRLYVLLRSPLFALMFILSLTLSIAANLPAVTEALSKLTGM